MRNPSTHHSRFPTSDRDQKLQDQKLQDQKLQDQSRHGQESNGLDSRCLPVRRCRQQPNLRLLVGLLLTFGASASGSALIIGSATAQRNAPRLESKVGSKIGSGTTADGPLSDSVSDSVSDSKVRDDLHRILQQKEFLPDRSAEDEFSKSVKNRLAEVRTQWKRLVKWFEGLFKTGAMSGGNVILTYVIVGLILCLFIPIVYYLIRNRAKLLVTATPLPRPRAKEEEALPDIVRDLTFWEAEAADWEAKQNYRLALRARFIFLLLTLDGVNLISYHRARTTGDYLHDLNNLDKATGEKTLSETLRSLVPTLIRNLAPLAQAFDRAWYGPTETTEQEYAPLKASLLHTTRQLSSQPKSNTNKVNKDKVDENKINGIEVDKNKAEELEGSAKR